LEPSAHAKRLQKTVSAQLSRAERTAVFIFGVGSYLVGLVAMTGWILIMLGVIPFVGGTLIGLETRAALFVDLILLVGFAWQHSAMARPGFKAKWTRITPPAAERSMYVLASGIALFLVLAFWQPMPSVVWYVETPLLRWLIYAAALGGWAYLLAASFAINHFELLGLQQVYQNWRGREITTPPFEERWMYRFDRHPIMTGALFGMWATPTMRVDHLLLATGFTAYIVIGVFFEERSLLRQWGVQYADYCSRVGSIVPSVALWLEKHYGMR
jgi:protein-S-isoprenylcysteine O-methyltransferase Ste14